MYPSQTQCANNMYNVRVDKLAAFGRPADEATKKSIKIEVGIQCAAMSQWYWERDGSFLNCYNKYVNKGGLSTPPKTK